MYCLRVLGLILSALLLASCATGPRFEPAPSPGAQKALVYIYRPAALTASARRTEFFVNDRSVATLSSGGYTHLYLDPGNYAISQKWAADIGFLGSQKKKLEVEAGKTYYYRFANGSDTGCGPVCFEWQLQSVPESTAISEIAECRFQEAGS